MKSKIWKLKSIVLGAAVLGLALVSVASLADVSYVIHDLGSEAAFGQPWAINDSGTVLGRSDAGTLLWDQATGTRNITASLAPSFAAHDMNNAEVIAGAVVTNTQPIGIYIQAALWDPLNGNLALPTLGANTGALQINDAGQAVGWYRGPGDGPTSAVEWDSPTSVRVLASLGGASIAQAINNNGYAAGISQDLDGRKHVVMWSPTGQIADLGVPFGSDALGVRGIDGANKVLISVSNTEFGAGPQSFIGNGTYWQEIIPDSNFTFAYDMSAAGSVVGITSLPSSGLQAFVWNAAGGPSILPTNGSGIPVPLVVNNEGVIAGLSPAPDGTLHDVLWTPVPEPSSLLALAGGMLGFLGLTGRRRKRPAVS